MHPDMSSYLNGHEEHHDAHIPLIWEQAVSDGGYTDLNLLNDPRDHLHDRYPVNIQANGLPSHAIDPSILAGSSSLPNPHSPMYQPQHYEDTSKKEPLSPLNLTELQMSLPNSLNHLGPPSPNHSHSGDQTPSSCGSEFWETSSQFDLGPLDGGGASPSPSGNNWSNDEHANPLSLRRSVSDGGKDYRRKIEKKSREKKNVAYNRLKRELEASTGKAFESRSQCEVFEGASKVLGETRKANHDLTAENRALREKLKQLGMAI